MKKKIKIWVTGHNGMLGSAICRRLKKFQNIKVLKASRKDLDLKKYNLVNAWLKKKKPDGIIISWWDLC